MNRHHFVVISLLLFLIVGVVVITFFYTIQKTTFKVIPRAQSNACELRTNGDSNCDGKVDLFDFDAWTKQYNNEVKCNSADFNNDKKCDLMDYFVWYREYTVGE